MIGNKRTIRAALLLCLLLAAVPVAGCTPKSAEAMASSEATSQTDTSRSEGLDASSNPISSGSEEVDASSRSVSSVSESLSASSRNVSSHPDVASSAPPVQPASSAPAAAGSLPAAPASSSLEALRSTSLYRAVQALNSNADYTAPNAFGTLRYNANYLSANGFETVNGQPDYAFMQREGMCCAAFVNYYLFNFLPNVEHIDAGVTWKNSPVNNPSDLQLGRICANSIAYTMQQASAAGEGGWRCSYFVQPTLGTNYGFIADDYAAGKMAYSVGDVLVFSSTEYNYYHVGFYAGYYEGQHWIAHCTATPDHIGVTLSTFNGYSIPKPNGVVIFVTGIYHRAG